MHRYLQPWEIDLTLRRGKSVAQYLGRMEDPRWLQYVCVYARADHVELVLETVEDAGALLGYDLTAFPARDQERPTASVVASGTPEAVAQVIAWGGAPDRFVHESMLGAEYAQRAHGS